MNFIRNEEYKNWITEIKGKISSAQIKASLSVNSEMLKLYWDLGQSISEKLSISNWGTKVVENMSKDLQNSFPNLDGFSKRNLLFMRQWFDFYQNADNEQLEIMKQLVSQLPNKQNQIENIKFIASLIPWGHNILIIQKTQNIEQALFYTIKTIENNWSRAVLGFQIENQLYERQGKAITNFKLTLPKKTIRFSN